MPLPKREVAGQSPRPGVDQGLTASPAIPIYITHCDPGDQTTSAVRPCKAPGSCNEAAQRRCSLPREAAPSIFCRRERGRTQAQTARQKKCSGTLAPRSIESVAFWFASRISRRPATCWANIDTVHGQNLQNRRVLTAPCAKLADMARLGRGAVPALRRPCTPWYEKSWSCASVRGCPALARRLYGMPHAPSSAEAAGASLQYEMQIINFLALD